jgi:hypothetical protein
MVSAWLQHPPVYFQRLGAEASLRRRLSTLFDSEMQPVFVLYGNAGKPVTKRNVQRTLFQGSAQRRFSTGLKPRPVPSD